MLRIRAISQKATPGDFGAEVSGVELKLPKEVAEALASHGVSSAADMVAYLQTYPTSIANDLHWRVEDVMAGIDRLNTILRGHVDEDILTPIPRPHMSYGARRPPGSR